MRRLLLALLVLTPLAAHADASGKAMVLDGDTVSVDGQDVSLAGIHAPTIAQSCNEGDAVWSCGWDAANRLEAIIDGRDVTCVDVVEFDTNRWEGRCSVDGEDLAGLMIDEGMAVADPDKGAEYQARAQVAADAKVGIWSGPFIDPKTYAQIGNCSCTARKKSMMETAAIIKAQKEADAAAAAEAATQ